MTENPRRAASARTPRRLQLVVAILALTGCLLPSCDGGGQGGGGTDGRLRVAVIPKGTTHVFWKSIEAGARRAGKDLDVEILWKGPLKEDEREAQRKVIENFIASNVNGIVLAPLDESAMVAP